MAVKRKALSASVVKTLKAKAFEAQRSGNLRLAGKYLNEAEFLETEILQEEEKNNESR